MVAASARCAIGLSLSPGQAGDAPEGRAPLHLIQGAPELAVSCHLLIDCAYEGNEPRQLALDPASLPRCRRFRTALNGGGSRRPHLGAATRSRYPSEDSKAIAAPSVASTSSNSRSSPSSTSLLSWKHCVSSVNTPWLVVSRAISEQGLDAVNSSHCAAK